MAKLIAERKPTKEIIDIDGEKVNRTTTITDVSESDLQTQMDNLDEQIASTTARYVTPLVNRRDAIVEELAILTA